MRIPKDAYADYKCEKCGRYEFDFLKKEDSRKQTILKIYCSTCGRFLKNADEDEQNLYELKRQKGEQARQEKKQLK